MNPKKVARIAKASALVFLGQLEKFNISKDPKLIVITKESMDALKEELKK